jgi:hypothetical protein
MSVYHKALEHSARGTYLLQSKRLYLDHLFYRQSVYAMPTKQDVEGQNSCITGSPFAMKRLMTRDVCPLISRVIERQMNTKTGCEFRHELAAALGMASGVTLAGV